jgi:FixJ family two-component response regulator
MADGRLLVLDDDEAVAQTVAFVAEQHGFAVRTTSEPEDFFNQINAWSPTHIVIDLVMPAMDGVEVLRSLAGSGCVANIIVMSGMGAKILDSARRGAAERGLRIGGILP